MEDFAALLCVCGLPLFGLVFVPLIYVVSQERAQRKRATFAVEVLEGRVARLEQHAHGLEQRLVALTAPIVTQAPSAPAVAPVEVAPAHVPDAHVVAPPFAHPPDATATWVETAPVTQNVALAPSQPYVGATYAAPEPLPHAPALDVTPEQERKLDLEQWLGLRGAAVAGALVLVAAGAAFFQYSIERGLLGPFARVTIGALVGVALMGAGELPVARGYARLARLLQGAGASIAYFAAWSASALYGLAPAGVSFAAMVAITAATCFLSARHASLATASLGLAGGFATPLLLSSGADRPIALFAYLGVLDVALVYLARRNKWGGLTLFALGATLLYEAGWVVERMRLDRIPLGMLVVVGLGALFALLADARGPGDEAPEARGFGLARLVAALSPFVFVLHTSLERILLVHAVMLAAFTTVMHAATLYLARIQRSSFLAVAGAGATSAVMLVAMWHAASAHQTTWPFAIALGLASIVHAFVSADDDGADLLAACALLAALVRGAVAHREALPIALVLVAVGVFVLAHRAFTRTRKHAPYVLAGLGALATVVTVFAQRHVVDAVPENALPIACDLLAFTLAALALRAPEAMKVHATHACALGVTILVVGLAPWSSTDCVTAAGTSATCIAITAMGLYVARGVPVWPVVLVLGLGVPLLASLGHPRESRTLDALRAALLLAAPAALHAAVRLSTEARSHRAMRLASALAPFVVAAPLAALWHARFGAQGMGAVAVALSVAPLVVSRPFSSAPFDGHFVAAVTLISLGVVLELDGNAVVAALLALGAATAYLWQRASRLPYGLATTALVGLACLRALACWIRPSYGLYYPFLSPITLGFVFGAVMLFVIAAFAERVHPSTPDGTGALDDLPRAVALGARLAGFVLLFAFCSLVFRDAFGPERSLAMPFDRGLLIAVSTSLGYAAYAMTLVGVGLRRDLRTLRAAGLALFALTSLKIFLVDLGDLRDLYRVASLLGLAIALLLVSVAYQRFVLRRPATSPPRGA